MMKSITINNQKNIYIKAITIMRHNLNNNKYNNDGKSNNS